MPTQTEGKHIDYKCGFDAQNPKAKIELLKNLIAMANAGGGQIIFGCSETSEEGVDEATRRELDSARLADAASLYTQPAILVVS